MNFLVWAGLTAFLVVLLLPSWLSFDQLFPHLFTLNPKNHNHSQIIKHTNKQNCLCVNMHFWSCHPYETPPSKTVTCRISALGQAHGRLCTLKAEGEERPELLGGLGPIGSWELGGRWGKGTLKNPGSLRKGKEEKSPMFATIRTTCSFDTICNLVGSLGSWLRNLLELQIWHDCR